MAMIPRLQVDDTPAISRVELFNRNSSIFYARRQKNKAVPAAEY